MIGMVESHGYVVLNELKLLIFFWCEKCIFIWVEGLKPICNALNNEFVLELVLLFLIKCGEVWITSVDHLFKSIKNLVYVCDIGAENDWPSMGQQMIHWIFECYDKCAVQIIKLLL